MKISYVLLNQEGKNRSVPRGAAWQWIHQVNDEDQMQLVFEQLKKKIAASDLTVANLRINQRDYAVCSWAQIRSASRNQLFTTNLSSLNALSICKKILMRTL